MANIQWGYAVNQWRNMEVDFVRKDQMESAFKVISVCGFNAIEITDTALGGHMIPDYFGTAHAFMEFLHGCGVERVCSLNTGIDFGVSPTNPADHDRMVAGASRSAQFIAELGATRLVVRPMPPYWREAPITDEKIKAAAECWNRVGEATRAAGVVTTMHVDFLCGVRNPEALEKLLALTSPETVGLTLDTAELTIAGIDPVGFYKKHHARVNHLHFKDAVTTDTLDEYKDPNAEIDYWPNNLILAGAKRHVERWYYEMGTPGGLVDFPALAEAMLEHNYEGWVVVESDQSPFTEESVMLNGWYKRFVLSKVLTGNAHAAVR
jgi:inosose dehydratase